MLQKNNCHAGSYSKEKISWTTKQLLVVLNVDKFYHIMNLFSSGGESVFRLSFILRGKSPYQDFLYYSNPSTPESSGALASLNHNTHIFLFYQRLCGRNYRCSLAGLSLYHRTALTNARIRIFEKILSGTACPCIVANL